MNIVALIQARMGSSRLPCKTMLCLHGLPVIDWVLQRTAASLLLNGIMVALPDTPLDDILARHLEDQGVPFIRGPEQDVLKRFVLAGHEAGATHIVRVCADNPCIWGPEIDHLIRHYQALPDQENAYAYNHIPRNNLYADGLGAEMISFDLLCRLDREAVAPEHREHCLSYISANPQSFVISTFDPPDPRLRRPDVRLDLDRPEDFRTLSLMAIHAGMAPAEILLRYPKAQPQLPL